MAKKSRKELLKQDDAFTNAAGQGMDWIRENPVTFVVAIVAVFAVLAIVLGGKEYVAKSNSEASALLSDAQEILEAEVVEANPADPEAATADPDADPPTFASIEARQEAAKAAFEKAAENAGVSNVGTLARIYLADLEHEMGNTDVAIDAFRALRKDLDRKDGLYPVVCERLSYLHESKSDNRAAIAVWEQFTKAKGDYYRDRAKFHLARLYKLEGNKDKAREILESIEKDFPESSLKPEVQHQLALLGRTATASAEVNGAQEPKD